PDGPGKALKLTISPLQERIPIYIAAIGPKNTALAGEIADGWIPTLFSPEHVSELRPLLEEGAASSGKSLDGFDIAPTVHVCASASASTARPASARSASHPSPSPRPIVSSSCASWQSSPPERCASCSAPSATPGMPSR